MNVHHDAHQHGHHAHADPAAGTVKDPVCGMTVDPQAAKHRTTHAGASYFFCSAGCRQKFEADPDRYLAPKSAAPHSVAEAPPVPAGTIYTCPMHPQVRQVGPGSCPICGMALEPEVATPDTGPSAERVDMERRFWIGLALAAPVVILEMGGHLANLHMLVPPVVSSWSQFALATPVVLWAGWPFFVRAAQSLRTRNLNMFTLIAMGTGVAWLYSVVATLAPSAFPAAFRAADGTVAI
jgi:P-type Cu+ transporter